MPHNLPAPHSNEEGFYKLGDALVFANLDDPLKGFCFNGRLSEDFKLSTGTWVSVGPLRAKLLTALIDVAQDVVFAGVDQSYVAALIFPLPGAPIHTLQALLEEFSRRSTGMSTRVQRAIVLDKPPSMDAGELTEKGTINQKAVLRNRANLVEELYAGSPRVLEIIV